MDILLRPTLLRLSKSFALYMYIEVRQLNSPLNNACPAAAGAAAAVSSVGVRTRTRYIPIRYGI